jgi:voltage-gated potassium channel Kch
MNFRYMVLLAAGVACMMIGMQCSNPVQTAGNGSDVGNGMVAGLIVDQNGSPVKGATVYIRRRSTLADTSTPLSAGTMGALAKRAATEDTVTTNDSGAFAIDSVDTGTYVVEGVSGDNLSLTDSVTVTDPDSTLTLEADTLKPAGAIKGVIRLSEGGDPRKVFVLAFGIDRFARVEADGSFRFSSLAEAAYDLRIISPLDDYEVLDTFSIPVVSADTTDLDTLELPFSGIPTIKGLSLTYDTLKQIVTLTWNQADTGLVSGYNVYRQHVDSGLVKLNAAVITDTVFRDSTALQDNSYTYQVKSVDKSGNEGLLSGEVGVEVVSAIEFVRFVGTQGTEIGDLGLPRGISVKDGKIFVAEEGNRRIQVFDSSGLSITTIVTAGIDSLVAPFDIQILSDTIYVLDDAASKVIIYNMSGNFIRTVDYSENMKLDKFIPHSSDSILVLSNNAGAVYWMDNHGYLFDSSTYSFDNAQDIAVVGDLIAVSDINRREVVYIDFALELSKTVLVEPESHRNVGGISYGNAIGPVAELGDGNLVVGANVDLGKLYIVDSNDNVIAKFTLAGQPPKITAADIFITDNGTLCAIVASQIQIYRTSF